MRHFPLENLPVARQNKGGMIAIMKRLTLPRILLFIIAIACIPLIISIVRMGYSIVFDFDELNHIQIVWLIAHGYIPYKDIYNSYYPPLFELFLLPVFLISGFSFDAMYMARYAMIILFAIRIIAMFLVIKNVFNRRIAIMTTVMFLLDPFVIFSSMQIRPDNLMITLFTVALIPFIKALRNYSPKWWMVTGVCVACALLTLPKLLPMVAVFTLGSLIYMWMKKKNLTPILWAVIGVVIPIGLFSFYLIIHGTFQEMFQETVREANTLVSFGTINVPYGTFYQPDNALIYGAMGKPLTWYYAWFLQFAPWSGVIIVLLEGLKQRAKITADSALRMLLGLGLTVQWAVLFFLPFVFIQYYIPVSWLAALFTAVGINALLGELSFNRMAQYALETLLFVACLLLIFRSISYNDSRDNANMADLRAIIEKRWSQIPPSTYTFPNFLFRPLAYPITYMDFIGNFPPAILNRLPPIPERLEKYHVKILIINDYLMSKLAPDVVSYIQSHYRRIVGDDEIMVRI